MVEVDSFMDGVLTVAARTASQKFKKPYTFRLQGEIERFIGNHFEYVLGKYCPFEFSGLEIAVYLEEGTAKPVVDVQFTLGYQLKQYRQYIDLK